MHLAFSLERCSNISVISLMQVLLVSLGIPLDRRFEAVPRTILCYSYCTPLHFDQKCPKFSPFFTHIYAFKSISSVMLSHSRSFLFSVGKPPRVPAKTDLVAFTVFAVNPRLI